MRFGTHKSKDLTAEEARLLVEWLVAISSASLPLASGLRSAATEMPSERLRTVVQQLADRVQQGEGLADVLREQLQYCDPSLSGAIAAALDSGQISEVLGQYIQQQRTRSELRHAVRGVLAYPLLLLTVCFAVVVSLSIFVMPGLADTISNITWWSSARAQMMAWWGQTGVWYLFVATSVLVVFAMVFRWRAGAAKWQRVKRRIPLLGPLFQWLGIVEWARSVSLLLGHQVPLSQAIRWATQGSADPAMRHDAALLGAGLDQGQSLASVLETDRHLPRMLALLVRWGEQTEQLPAALTAAADYFEDRVRLRLSMLRIIVPAIVFTVVALMVTLLFASFVDTIFLAVRFFWWWNSGSDSGASASELFRLLNLLAPLALGGAIVWVVSGVQAKHAREQGNALLSVIELAGWLLWIGSTLLLLLGLFGWPVFVPFTISYVVALVVTSRYRESERRALCTALAIAAERGIPLGKAMRAFAAESVAGQRVRVRKLADLLDAGTPLDEAMKKSRIRFPREVLMAVRLRGLAGELGPALRESMRRAVSVETLASGVLERMLYLSLVAAVGTGLFVTRNSWLVNIHELTGEFSVDLPANASWLLSVMEFLFMSNSFRLGLTVGVVVVLIGVLFAYLRWLPCDIPILRRLWLPLDSSTVLHGLALSMCHDRPMLETLSILRGRYPKRWIRRRLARAVACVERGGHWCQGLRAGGLINGREAALLVAAEKMGNLGWALNEIANRMLERTLFKMQRILDVVFPLVVLAIGLLVVAVAVAQFMPLVYFISANA